MKAEKADPSAIQEARNMARRYQDAKVRCVAYPRKRPEFLKQMGVSLDNYKATGFIDYDTDLASRISEKDADYIEQYADDMHTVWLMEKGVAAISNAKTRAIAEDTLLRGIRCEELVEKYGITDHAIRARKKKALILIAAVM